jgi:hypothetical protein
MELYQNQVTRLQGGFSLRMFHRSFGLMMIQTNIEAPCTLLDFPTLERFTEEISRQSYDVIGISGIIANVGKVAKMRELIRRHQPGATIVVGGHIANKERLDLMVDADLFVRGEGIRWFQRYLGQDDQAAIKHPLALSGFGSRIMGVELGDDHERTAAILIPSVGCPLGCNFCSTAALFGGKGQFINFYETGDELFSVICKIEKSLKVRSFFVLDENFLLHRKRALRLLELMEISGKSWSLSVFSSARVLKSYTMDQLMGLGIGFVWMGLEGEESAGRLLADMYAAFGWRTRMVAPLIGRYVYSRLKKEEAGLAAGHTYEPGSFCEKNAAALALEKAATAERTAGPRQMPVIPQPAWR